MWGGARVGWGCGGQGTRVAAGSLQGVGRARLSMFGYFGTMTNHYKFQPTDTD